MNCRLVWDSGSAFTHSMQIDELPHSRSRGGNPTDTSTKQLPRLKWARTSRFNRARHDIWRGKSIVTPNRAVGLGRGYG